jgi:hypothetical protein
VKDPAKCGFVTGGLRLLEARLGLGYTLIHKAPHPEHLGQPRLAHRALIIGGPDRVPLIFRSNVNVKHALKGVLGCWLFTSIMQTVADESISH